MSKERWLEMRERVEEMAIDEIKENIALYVGKEEADQYERLMFKLLDKMTESD